ncbi:MAG: alpha-L-fucosidase [Segetibacter sp.]|nr:alpha-L-fucosidase [Segetibacter sp.]
MNDIGKWLRAPTAKVFNTIAGYMKPQTWGAITQKEGKMFIHVLKTNIPAITLDHFPFTKISKTYLLKDKTKVTTSLKNSLVTITIPVLNADEPDQVIVLETKD